MLDELRPFALVPEGRRQGKPIKRTLPHTSKVRGSLEEALRTCGVADGMTLSFHHHFRNGDVLVADALECIHGMGVKNLHLAPSSLSGVHDTLLPFFEDGTIGRLSTSGLRGKLGEFVSGGKMKTVVDFRSHGGRAQAIESGDLKIDIAILAVPSADAWGNGGNKGKNSLCGSLGYAMVDALYADHVILVTDDLVAGVNLPASIDRTLVDHVVVVPSVGDASRIATGATRFTKNPKELKIAEKACEVIVASPYFKEGMSFQTGSGGSSLAVTRYLRQALLDREIRLSFILGGITEPMVKLLEEDLVDHLVDVQSFDLAACASIARNARHHEITASQYANPHNLGAYVNALDVVVLSALEIDEDFNVNVLTGADGVIRGASGGHSDTSAAAQMTLVVAPLYRGRIPTVSKSVHTTITPGETVDVFVCEFGVAVNPLRTDLIAAFEEAGIGLVAMADLRQKAERITGVPRPLEREDRTVARVLYRDGRVIDTVGQVKHLAE